MNTDTKVNKSKPTLISSKTFDNINKLLNRNNNRLFENASTSFIDDFEEVSNERPKSALLRGVKITDIKEKKVNPDPVHFDDDLLGNYLSPYKLQFLTGKKDLKKVKYFEVKVDGEKTAINSLGASLPNLIQLRFIESNILTLRNLGSNYKNLKVLWMSRCGLEDLDGLPSLTNLSELYLSCNHLRDVSSCSLLQHLSVLDLENNKIDDISQLSFLSLCSNLWNLTIKGNPICTKPDPHEETPIEYNYRLTVLENVGDQLKLLDGIFTNSGESDSKLKSLQYDENLFKVKETRDRLNVQKVCDEFEPINRKKLGNFEPSSGLESRGNVVCGNLAKMLKSKRTAKISQVIDTSHEEVDDGLSLDEEIKSMRQDLQESLKIMNSNVKPDVLKIHSDDDDDERDKYSFDVMKQNKNPQYVYDTEHRVNNDAKDETPEIDDHNETTLENDIFCEKNRQKSKKCSDLKEISRKDNFTMENRYSFDDWDVSSLDLKKSSGDYFFPAPTLETHSKISPQKSTDLEALSGRSRLEKQLTWTKKEKCKKKFKLPSLKTHLKPVEVVNKKVTRFSLQEIKEAKLNDAETTIILNPSQAAMKPSIKHTII